MTTLTINWCRRSGITFDSFREEFLDSTGIYIIGDAWYVGSQQYRTMTEDCLYIGQSGGGARRANENKTKNGRRKGTFGRRYESTYIPIIVAQGAMTLKNPDKGILIERPFYFGVVTEKDRDYILFVEQKLINLYDTKSNQYGYHMINSGKNKIKSIPDAIIHTGQLPVLLEKEIKETDGNTQLQSIQSGLCDRT